MASEGSNKATDAQETQTQQGSDATSQEIKDNFPVRKNDPRTSVHNTEDDEFEHNIPGDRAIRETASAG